MNHLFRHRLPTHVLLLMLLVQLTGTTWTCSMGAGAPAQDTSVDQHFAHRAHKQSTAPAQKTFAQASNESTENPSDCCDDKKACASLHCIAIGLPYSFLETKRKTPPEYMAADIFKGPTEQSQAPPYHPPTV